MELILLGTGCPKVDYKRFGPSNLIKSKKSKKVIFAGNIIKPRLFKLKLDFKGVYYILKFR